MKECSTLHFQVASGFQTHDSSNTALRCPWGTAVSVSASDAEASEMLCQLAEVVDAALCDASATSEGFLATLIQEDESSRRY